MKAAILRRQRSIVEFGKGVRRLQSGNPADFPVLLGESRSPLWTAESTAETSLQLGKVQNLRKACKRLNAVMVPAGEVFSFWKQLGRATRASGYVPGRELRQGCLIPTVGGGLCQLSNALYELVLRCNCEIIERHPHTAVVPGSAAEQGRDATVFWNYVDFRFRPRQEILITGVLSRNELIVCFWGKQPFQVIQLSGLKAQSDSGPDTCTDCDKESCFRHIKPSRPARSSKTAFLIEECWPEFQEFVARVRTGDDVLYLPFRSPFWTNPRYDWQQNGFHEIHSASFPTALSALKGMLGSYRRKTQSKCNCGARTNWLISMQRGCLSWPIDCMLLNRCYHNSGRTAIWAAGVFLCSCPELP